jgi:hypothetical protein
LTAQREAGQGDVDGEWKGSSSHILLNAKGGADQDNSGDADCDAGVPRQPYADNGAEFKVRDSDRDRKQFSSHIQISTDCGINENVNGDADSQRELPSHIQLSADAADQNKLSGKRKCILIMQ